MKKLFCSLLSLLSLLLVVPFKVCLANDYLISPGTYWHYYDLSHAPEKNWYRAPDIFERWPRGKAPLGYGEGDESQVTDFGENPQEKPITQYFATTFNVTDVSQIDDLRLHILVDDGAVIYLNGSVLQRLQLPEQFDHSTQAQDSFIEGVWQSFGVPEKRLRKGRNIIAARVHQLRPSSSDLSFDLALKYQRTGLNARLKPVTLSSGGRYFVSVDKAKVFSRSYVLDLTEAAQRLKIKVSGGSGDYDLYVQKDEPPKLNHWLARSQQSLEEEVVITQATPGKYFVRLYAYRPFADAQLSIHW